MILCISVLSVVISPFSFLILLIWFFSLCFLMSLVNGLSILFILSKNQLLALLIFTKVSFVSSALIAVAKTSKTMLNSNGDSWHPYLVPDFRGNAFSFSPLRIMFAVGLSYTAFIMLKYVPSTPAFWRVFIINGCWILHRWKKMKTQQPKTCGTL